jgi:hypothetical protein
MIDFRDNVGSFCPLERHVVALITVSVAYNAPLDGIFFHGI